MPTPSYKRKRPVQVYFSNCNRGPDYYLSTVIRSISSADSVLAGITFYILFFFFLIPYQKNKYILLYVSCRVNVVVVVVLWSIRTGRKKILTGNRIIIALIIFRSDRLFTSVVRIVPASVALKIFAK